MNNNARCFPVCCHYAFVGLQFMYGYCVIDMTDVVREVCVAATSFVVESPTKPQEIGNGDVKIVRTLLRSHVETRRCEMTTTSTYIPWYIIVFTVLYAYRMCISEELHMLYKLFQITSPIFIYFVCRETLLDVTLKYFITPSRDDRETQHDVTEGGESDATSEAVLNAISAANDAGVEDSHDDVSWINELLKKVLKLERLEIFMEDMKRSINNVLSLCYPHLKMSPHWKIGKSLTLENNCDNLIPSAIVPPPQLYPPPRE